MQAPSGAVEPAGCGSGLRTCRGRFRRRIRALVRQSEAASAVEFALVAPVLFFALLAMTDLGLAVHERMTIDHILRAAAQAAMADAGEERVLTILQATGQKNFTLAEDAAADSSDTLQLSVSRFYSCPEAPNVEVPVDTTCDDSAPTYAFYRMAGAKTYDGLVIPDTALGSTVKVQVR